MLRKLQDQLVITALSFLLHHAAHQVTILIGSVISLIMCLNGAWSAEFLVIIQFIPETSYTLNYSLYLDCVTKLLPEN